MPRCTECGLCIVFTDVFVIETQKLDKIVSNEFCGYCFGARKSNLLLCPILSHSIWYECVWKRPTVKWFQENCFFLPNSITSLILDEYLPISAAKQTDYFGIREYKKLFQHYLKSKKITFTLYGRKTTVTCDHQFQQEISTWFSKIHSDSFNWFEIPNYDHFNELKRKRSRIDVLEKELEDERRQCKSIAKWTQQEKLFQEWTTFQ